MISCSALLASVIIRWLVEQFTSRDVQAATLHHDLSTLKPRELEVLHKRGRKG